MTTSPPDIERHAPLLRAMANLTYFHRAHEQFYGAARRETAVLLQRHARTYSARTNEPGLVTTSFSVTPK